MAAPKSVWGIDVGQRALKALKLRIVDGRLQVDALDIIEHPTILSADAEVDSREAITDALMQFLSRNSVDGSAIAISVPGQSSFTRFVKLPPVEKKKIPGLIRFEAEQQIPFNIDDVVWRWQTFEDPDSPDVEAGIFAMKREDVANALSSFTEVDLKIDIVQMAPLALYNFMTFDEQVASDGATLLADVGTDKTDLVIADGSRIWTRTIQVGGNNFTEALVKAFKLSFPKAEKLKRTAATSKYARQIFQAMRPVFAELVQEIQRSIGYYTSLHRDARFKKLLGIGNGFRLPGLQKFLEQNLNMPVVRVDTYNQVSPSPAVNAPTFTENVLSFAVAYGLALQGLELTPVDTNLLPEQIARQRLWAKKKPWFAGAAAALLVALAMLPYKAYSDLGILKDRTRLAEAQGFLDQQSKLRNRLQAIKDLARPHIQDIEEARSLLNHRGFWATLTGQLAGSLLSGRAFAQQELLNEYAMYLATDKDVRKEIESLQPLNVERLQQNPNISARDLQTLRDALNASDDTALVENLKRLYDFRNAPRDSRRVASVESMTTRYLPTLDEARAMVQKVKTGESSGASGPSSGPPGSGSTTTTKSPRAFYVEMAVRTPLSKSQANVVFAELQRITEGIETEGMFRVVQFEYGDTASAGRGGGFSPSASRMMPEGFTLPNALTGSVREGSQPGDPDPLFPNEDMSQDSTFRIAWAVEILDPSAETAGPKAAGNKE